MIAICISLAIGAGIEGAAITSASTVLLDVTALNDATVLE